MTKFRPAPLLPTSLGAPSAKARSGTPSSDSHVDPPKAKTKHFADDATFGQMNGASS
jgi:hypothetical protein